MNENAEAVATDVKVKRTRKPREKKPNTNANHKMLRVEDETHRRYMAVCDALGVPTNKFLERLIGAIEGDIIENGSLKETPLSRRLLGLPAK
jgi:hypothetical protein